MDKTAWSAAIGFAILFGLTILAMWANSKLGD
jgi:hypothetical protein